MRPQHGPGGRFGGSDNMKLLALGSLLCLVTLAACAARDPTDTFETATLEIIQEGTGFQVSQDGVASSGRISDFLAGSGDHHE